MSKTHYLYAKTWGNNILYRGIKDGKSFCEKVKFSPTLYIPSTKKSNSQWKSLYGNNQLEPVEFNDIKEAKEFINTYKDIDGVEVHGFNRWEYCYLNQQFPGDIEYDLSAVNILTLDIEVVSDGFDGDDESFPDIINADTPIVLISLHSSKTDKTILLGLKDYNPSSEDKFEYIRFISEKEMLKYFINYNTSTMPDIWTGWNTEAFDIPYLINRITKLFNEDMAKKLSPFGIINERKIEVFKKEVQTFEIVGIVSLDYLQLYKKIGTYSAKESYSLGFIAQEELGHSKAPLPGKGFRDNLNNHYDLFCRYCSIDSILVKELEDKLKLIDLAFTLAYTYHCNLTDIFRTVLPWEVYIFNYLHAKNIAVPPRKGNGIAESFDGAYVKDPIPGMYDWIVSFDAASLYPSIIWQWNISPEMLSEDGVIGAKNGAKFLDGRMGFLPEMVRGLIIGRKSVKKEMLKYEREYEDVIKEINNRERNIKT